jgi:hypothetical protein
MSQAVVGKSVDGWCARCKLVLAHTVEAIVNGKITRTHCNTCGGQHAHRANPPGTKSAKGRTAGRTTRAASPVIDYRAQLQGKDVSKARPYKLSDRFLLNEIINHPTFGVGLVVGLRDTNKIDVGFPDGLKTLAHGASL